MHCGLVSMSALAVLLLCLTSPHKPRRQCEHSLCPAATAPVFAVCNLQQKRSFRHTVEVCGVLSFLLGGWAQQQQRRRGLGAQGQQPRSPLPLLRAAAARLLGAAQK
jgi:hypothetical protein